MTLEQALIHLEDMYIDADEEYEKLLREDLELAAVAAEHKRALAVAMESLYVFAAKYPTVGG